MGKIDKISIDSTEYEIVPEIAPLFNPSDSYSTGDCVIHNAVLYKFTANHTGAWTGNDVVAFEVGSELVRLGSGGSGSGLTEDIKIALLACFEKVAWIDEDGQDYYDALYDALYPPTDLSYISAVFTQGQAVIYDTDSLDTLKQYLVVTAHMSDSTTQTITSYALSGTLTEGTSTITVSYSGKTTTFNVAVTHYSAVWYYPFNNSLLSEGTEEFGFTGQEVYDDGLFNRKCYHHVVVGDTDSQLGLKAVGITKFPDFGKDFTLSVWCARDDTVAQTIYPFFATKYINNNIPGTRYFSSVTAESGVTVTNQGHRNTMAGIGIQGYQGKINLRISNSDLTASSMLSTVLPSGFDISEWHHYAFTRKGNNVRVFIDGTLMCTAVASYNNVYNPQQVAISTFWKQDASDPSSITTVGYGTRVQDLYISDFCKWESSFDPTQITY